MLFLSEMELILEFKVTSKSPIIGMTIQEIEQRYGIRVIHVHKGLSENMEKFNPPTDKKVEASWYIKVIGPYKKVSAFGVEASK